MNKGRYHPDRHLDVDNKSEAQRKFSIITAAYETLSDPSKRSLYPLLNDFTYHSVTTRTPRKPCARANNSRAHKQFTRMYSTLSTQHTTPPLYTQHSLQCPHSTHNTIHANTNTQHTHPNTSHHATPATSPQLISTYINILNNTFTFAYVSFTHTPFTLIPFMSFTLLSSFTSIYPSQFPFIHTPPHSSLTLRLHTLPSHPLHTLLRTLILLHTSL